MHHPMQQDLLLREVRQLGEDALRLKRGELALTLTKKPNGEGGYDLFLNGEKVDETKARVQITDLVTKNKDIQAVIAGDKGIAYGDVMHIVDLVKTLGVTKFAMATDGT